MIGMQLLCKNLYKDITRNLMCIRDNGNMKDMMTSENRSR